MKLLAVVHGYPDQHLAGAEWMLHGILRWMQDQGHETRVLVGGPSGTMLPPDERKTTFQGVSVEPLHAGAEQEAMRWCDVAFTHLNLTMFAVRAARIAKKPLVHLVHNHLQLIANRVRSSETALVVFNSEWLKQACQWRGPSTVIHPPVFVKDYRVKPGKSITLVNVIKAKGAGLFWELAEREPSRQFLAVKGAYGDQLIPDVRLSNVKVMEQQADAREFYRKTRVLLMPSDYESYGRCALEAAASGIPTIAAPTLGLEEALGAAGTFVPLGNVGGWREALMKLDDPDVYAERSAAARKHADSLTPDADLKRLEMRLQELVR